MKMGRKARAAAPLFVIPSVHRLSFVSVDLFAVCPPPSLQTEYVINPNRSSFTSFHQQRSRTRARAHPAHGDVHSGV